MNQQYMNQSFTSFVCGAMSQCKMHRAEVHPKTQNCGNFDPQVKTLVHATLLASDFILVFDIKPRANQSLKAVFQRLRMS